MPRWAAWRNLYWNPNCTLIWHCAGFSAVHRSPLLSELLNARLSSDLRSHICSAFFFLRYIFWELIFSDEVEHFKMKSLTFWSKVNSKIAAFSAKVPQQTHWGSYKIFHFCNRYIFNKISELPWQTVRKQALCLQSQICKHQRFNGFH